MWHACRVGIHLWAFVGISLLVIIAPGPDTALVTKNAVLHGRSAALGSSLGVNAGLLIWTGAAAGLSGRVRVLRGFRQGLFSNLANPKIAVSSSRVCCRSSSRPETRCCCLSCYGVGCSS
jgi:threonine/homoserine/homoserine lactone efflux protein